MITTDGTVRALVVGIAVMAAIAASPAKAKVEGDKIVLGSAISFTGKYSTIGIHAKNGYVVAINRINEMGGVTVGGRKYKLAIKFYDNESIPARTADLLARLVEKDGIKYFLGPYSSATTKAAALTMKKYKRPMVAAGAASRSLFARGYRSLFGVPATPDQYMTSAIALKAEIARRAGKKPRDVQVALSFENDPFARDVRAGVLEDIEKRGFTVVVDDRMPRDLADLAVTMSKVKTWKPDLLIVSGQADGTVAAARLIKEMNIDVPMIAMTHCESAEIVSRFGAASNDFLCPTQWARTLDHQDRYFGTAAAYDAHFKKSFDDYTTVPYQAAQASAAVLVWKEAFERANAFDTEKLRDALAATDLETFYGKIRFSNAGNNIAKPVLLRQIQKGDYHVVAPPEWATRTVNFPRKAH